MSTKNLIGGKQAKAGKKRRQRAIRELQNLSRMYQEGSPQRFRVESRIQALKETAADPRFTDAEKDAKFKSLLAVLR